MNTFVIMLLSFMLLDPSTVGKLIILLQCTTLWTCILANICHLWNPYFSCWKKYFTNTISVMSYSAFPRAVAVCRLVDQNGLRHWARGLLTLEYLERVLLQPGLAAHAGILTSEPGNLVTVSIYQLTSARCAEANKFPLELWMQRNYF